MGVDIAGGAEIAAENDSAYAEDTAAAAEVKGALALPGVIFRQGTCALLHARRFRTADRGSRRSGTLPTSVQSIHSGTKELFADLERLIIPFQLFSQSASHTGAVFTSTRLHGIEQPRAVLVILNIEFNARNALIAFLERGIDIVPILAVIFKEGLEIVLRFR